MKAVATADNTNRLRRIAGWNGPDGVTRVRSLRNQQWTIMSDIGYQISEFEGPRLIHTSMMAGAFAGSPRTLITLVVPQPYLRTISYS